jgi:Pyruvate/2-oxoacid:ferredoxin oxidoreductase delta subunit
LCETMARRGGRYPGKDIPEFYAVAEELFTPDEAEVTNAMPRGATTPAVIARELGRGEDEVREILEGMADKGLCSTIERDGERFYLGPPFVPGIFEYRFFRGTRTEKDKKLAKLVHAYKTAFDVQQGPPEAGFPTSRVIPVDQKIQAGNQVHTYDQMMTYVEDYDPISVATCYCRHEAELIDATDVCGKPNDVCMHFGKGAEFLIERGMGRRATKEEAREILKRSEEAGLVHVTRNSQEIDFICNCCPDHCMVLRTALAHPKPALFLTSGFHPVFDSEACVACETCVGACPAAALTLGGEEVPDVDPDRCFGCGVCATICPMEAVEMVAKADAAVPPVDRKALAEAVRAGR